MKQIDDDIKSGKLKKAYLIFGEESYLTKEYADKIRTAALDGGFAMMNSSVFDTKADIVKLKEAAETVPFGGNYRLLDVKDSGLFAPGRKDDTDELSKYLATSPPSSVFLFTHEKVDKKTALYKAVKKHGYVCEINKLKDRDLTGWVVQHSDGRLTPSLSDYLIKTVGNSMDVLTKEMDKLFSYTGSKKITTADIDTACTKSLETRIFDMVGAIGSKNADKALDIYNNMLLAKESPFGINKMIARQFRLILQCKYVAVKKKYNNLQIANELGLREFMVRECMAQSKNFTLKTLMDAIKDCAKTDSDIKKGLISDKLGVELLILKYASKENT